MAVFRHASQGVTVRNFWLWRTARDTQFMDRLFNHDMTMYGYRILSVDFDSSV